MSDISDDMMTVTAPRHRRRLSDKIIVAFHFACDQGDVEVTRRVWLKLCRATETCMKPCCNRVEPSWSGSLENRMQDVLDYLNDALAALRQVSEVSWEDANAIQKTIAALDVTVRLKASNEAPLNDMRSSWLRGGYRAQTT